MKIIEINKCFDECPHCIGPDWNRQKRKMMFTCQEIPAWIDDVDNIPGWCPLPERYLTQQCSGQETPASDTSKKKQDFLDDDPYLRLL